MQRDSQPWTFIAAPEFLAPMPPVSDAARGGALRVWTALKGMFGRTKSRTASADEQWQRPSAELLDTLTPVPDWSSAAEHFAGELGDGWFATAQVDRPVRVLIGPPGCDVGEVLRAVGRQRSARVLEAPAMDALLASQTSPTNFCEGEDTDGAILVIPNLEHWYLRHEQGLSTVRQLLENVTRSGRRALIGCDSWAWAFLRYASAVKELCGVPQTLAAMDVERLDSLFRSALDLQAFEFCHYGEQQLVFPPDTAPNSEAAKPPSVFLKSLAATARGNVSVALAFWRVLLRLPDDGRATENSPKSSGGASQNISVLSCFEDVRPKFPEDFAAPHRFILHASLLHGGLALEMLYELLPFPHHDVQGWTHSLLDAGILEYRQGRIAVALTAYPAVRQDLWHEGFLTDNF